MPSFSPDEYLKTFLNWESKLHQAASASFSLERIEKLLDIFGRPDDKLRFAHIAGTKGKGSTAAFLASILRASGYRVGLYTSPHLHSMCERIRVLEPVPGIDGSCRCGTLPSSWVPCPLRAEGYPPSRHPSMPTGSIPMQEIEARLRYHHDDIDRLRASGVEITFYELMTVIAVSYFSAQKVDIVVLETGLGGRLDATNVFETSVCGITPIGFDHMNILGNTLSAIAGEKAGIIKSPSQRVVLASQPNEAMDVLKQRCAEFNIHPEVVNEDISLAVRAITPEGVTFDVEGRRKYTGLISPLTGHHQAENAALAIGMAEDLETFGFVLNEGTVREGVSGVEWPARFEHVRNFPTMILDCAHTPESARALVATFCMAYPGRKAVFIIGMSSDKNADVFIEALKPVMQACVFTKANNPRAMDLSSTGLREHLDGVDVIFTTSVADAINEAGRMAGKDGIILVTGSVFVCAQARE